MKITALKTFIIIATISLTTTVFAQKSGEITDDIQVKKEELPEAIRNEIKNFHEKMKAINEECRKKRDELKGNLSPEAKKVVQDHKEKMKKNNQVKKEQDKKDSTH